MVGIFTVILYYNFLVYFSKSCFFLFVFNDQISKFILVFLIKLIVCLRHYPYPMSTKGIDLKFFKKHKQSNFVYIRQFF